MSSIDDKVKTILWYKNLKTSTNDVFFKLYSDKHRYMVLMGGGGSGKSIFAGRKILERVTSESSHRVLVVRKVARTLRESCFAQLVGQISEHYTHSDFRINKTDMSITHVNGSQILFAGLDDVEKLKSIYNITMIWIEEASEITESDFNQLDIRLRGDTKYYKQILLSFNPIDINHWLKKRFFDKLSDEVITHRSTYKDNRYLDSEAKKVLISYKDTDPYYYTVYCLGEWGVYGATVFDAAKVSKRLSLVTPPLATGLFEFKYDGQKIMEDNFTEATDGFIFLYAKPKPYHPYVIGADTAGEGSDYFAAHVLDNITGEEVAVMHYKGDEDVFARQIYCLGKYYNEALVGIEANFSSYPIKELMRLGYNRQYIRMKEDTYPGKAAQAYGFRTTQITRPVIIAELIKIVRESTDLINDRKTLEEMLTFVRNAKGRPEAQNGAHDDLIMSLAIAHYIREQQTYEEYLKPQKDIVYNFDFEKPEENLLGGKITIV